MDGLAAAHFKVHAVSPHAQARAQVWAEAQFGADMQASISLAHLSSEQVQASWQVALLQSMSAEVWTAAPTLHLLLMHSAAGRALMDGLDAAHFKVHASWQVALLQSMSADMHASISLAHLSREQVHASWQVALLQSMSAEVWTAAPTLHLLLMHWAAGNALMDG